MPTTAHSLAATASLMPDRVSMSVVTAMWASATADSHAVLDAGEHLGADDMACGPNHEEVAKAAVKNDLRRETRVRAAEDDRERSLSIGHGRPSFRILMRMDAGTGDEALIAGE